MTPEKYYETSSKLSLGTLTISAAAALLSAGAIVATVGCTIFYLVARI